MVWERNLQKYKTLLIFNKPFLYLVVVLLHPIHVGFDCFYGTFEGNGGGTDVGLYAVLEPFQLKNISSLSNNLKVSEHFY